MKSCKHHLRVAWFFQWVAAAILAQTLFFKFTGAEESRFIFTALGVEPWGRFATGLLELVAVVLLLTPRWAAWGGMLSLGLMSGAILGHLTRLGLVVRNDGGLLFGLATTVFVAAAAVVWLRRFQLPFLKGSAPRECRV
ncbi:MAG: DoxX family protein [Verrucomicrobiales bacterium]|nr:DoxX family protein [Verrucomicrobiales bacterium]